MFRIAWVVGAPTFGARFVAFCQQRLDLPWLDNDGDHDVLRVEAHRVPEGGDWKGLCRTLLAGGTINHVEHSILVSEPLDPPPRAPKRGRERGQAPLPDQLYALRLRWSSVLAGTDTSIPDTTLAVAVMSGGTLRLLRVQDHVRRLGLATGFMRRLINTQAVTAVDIRAGHYGLGGICRNRHADRLQAWLQRTLDLARHRHRMANEANLAKRNRRRRSAPASGRS